LADDILGIKISKIILEGPDNELKLTQNTQPAIMVVSYAIFKVLKDEFGLKLNEYKYFAGHSLGEYSALVCSESLDFKDSLFLLKERGKAMQNAVPVGKGAMVAVLGCELIELKNFFKKMKSKEICEIANDNAPGQLIVSGEINAINELKEILTKEKKKNISLPVSAPFHCSLMNKASEEMKDKINSINFNIPKVDIVSNITASPEKNPNKIKKLLIDQIFSTVRWRESIELIQKNGVTTFIEIGPGKVLSGLTKRIARGVKIININNIKDIDFLK
jgi:[acyl-carrier-protein] S-malonyltransferase